MVFSTSRAVIAFPQSSEAVRIADSAEDRSAADSRLGSFSLRVQEVLNADATNRVNIKNMRRVAISEDSLLDRCTTRVTIRFVQRTNHHNTFRSQGGNHTLFPLSKTGVGVEKPRSYSALFPLCLPGSFAFLCLHAAFKRLRSLRLA